MYKSILVPVDLSHADVGKHSIKIASRLADEGARIVLLTVIEDIPTYVAAEIPSDIIEKTKTTAVEGLSALAGEMNIGAEVVIRNGHTRSAILAVADEITAELIIIGSHKPGLEDYLLGSTAGRVVRHATCSVLVVR